MTVEIWQADQPKGRRRRWSFRVTAGDAVVFDSAWVAVRYADRSDAEWLATMIDRLVDRCAFAGSPGHSGQTEPVLWRGDIGTDHGTTVGGIHCHAEHLYGPVRGGAWYCQVYGDKERYFHTADSGIQPRSGSAAWWICEVVVSAVLAGAWAPRR